MREHPELCYIFLKTTGEVGIVKWGESGYYRTEYQGFTENMVQELNQNGGISPVQANAMMSCSMNKNLKSDEDWKKAYDIFLYISEKGRKC